VAGFVTDAPAKGAPTICSLSKPDMCSTFWSFHTDCNSTQLLTHWHKHYRF
jgi:hypothetical protein